MENEIDLEDFEAKRGVEIEDTYAEAFSAWNIRILITGERGISGDLNKTTNLELDELIFAAYRSTSTPSMVVGRVEAGIEQWVFKKYTPDKRDGVILQFWGKYDKEDPKKSLEKFYEEFSIRIRQDILSVPTLRVFSPWKPGLTKNTIDTGFRIGRCGGGYEEEVEAFGRKMIKVPLMMGHDFLIEKYLPYSLGICGANLWFFCDSVDTGRKVGRLANGAIKDVDGVISSFYVCPSGSMIGNYPPIGPPTNYCFCPTLKKKIRNNSKVPVGIESIPEIVIDGLTECAVKKAMRNAIYAVLNVSGIVKISAGNYDGKLGDYKIYLRDVIDQSS